MRAKFLFAGALVFIFALVFSFSCQKVANGGTPTTDTVTVVKNDTTNTSDTLYATKPDSTVNLTKGLLVYLPFSGNIADSSGNNNPTTAIGNVLTYDEHGYANNAFGSTSNGNEVLVTNNGSIQFDTAYSLSFDFMVNDIGIMTYVSMVNPVNGQGPTFNIGNTMATAYNFSMGTGDSIIGCDSIGSVNNYNIMDTTNFIPQPDAWYNVVAIYHVGSVQIYVNGSLISQKTGQGHAAELCPASQIVVGAWWNGDEQGINGKLDNIRLYDRVLTPHEIATLASYYQVTSTGQKIQVQRRPI